MSRYIISQNDMVGKFDALCHSNTSLVHLDTEMLFSRLGCSRPLFEVLILVLGCLALVLVFL